MQKRFSVLILFLIGVLLFSKCANEKVDLILSNEEASYLGHEDSAAYVGIDVCKQCHYDKFETFIRTGMGSSFAKADSVKSIAQLSANSTLYDSFKDLHYHPYWSADSLVLNEYRLIANLDTSFSRKEKVDYVVGSGQHTNSHIFDENHYLYQLPFTWYAQKNKLDLPPGYEQGENVRFDRIIGLECMSCHNAMPTAFVKGSENKFKQIPQGIDCERCHGPGEAHVAKIQRGEITDTSKFIDYSIVNPKKLEVQLQFEICQRCHLQGNIVLQEGKSFFDFKPGMKLNDVMDVYLPKFEGKQDEFIMASHVDRFKESACFKNSTDYTCTSCHDPHISVKETNINTFNTQCISCHSSNSKDVICSESIDVRNLGENNCVSCHMPASGSIDIPHVSVHDHWVRKNGKIIDTTGIGEFVGLIAVNNKKPSNRSKAMAYLQQYERFNANNFLLDSALFFLYKFDANKNDLRLWTHYFYLKSQYDKVVNLIETRNLSNVLDELSLESYDNNQAWTAYRIGESFSTLGRINEALLFYKKAAELAPFVPDFSNKLGVAYLKLNELETAKEIFITLLKESPSHKEGLNNLGYCYLLDNDLDNAERYFKKTLKLDSDYKLAWLNLANVYSQKESKILLTKCLKEVLRIDPDHENAKQLLKKLS